VKISDLILHGAGIIIGIILGIIGFLKLYLPLKESMGLGTFATQGLGEEGQIVPMERLIPLYQMGGSAIDLIVLIAFAIAGIYLVLGILRAVRCPAT
jgi:hypothetical protein